VDWEFLQEPSLRSGNLQLMDPAKLTFSNWDHPNTSPVISGEISEWKNLRRRWVKGYYCVSGHGNLMQFEHPLDQLVSNIIPKKSRDLRGALLGSINLDTPEAWFTIMSDKWQEDEPSYGVKKYAKAPIKLAKHTMSKLTTIKLQMSHRDAQRWHHVLGQFTRTKQHVAVGSRLVLSGLSISGRNHHVGLPPLNEGHIEDDDDAIEIVPSSSNSVTEVTEAEGEEEDQWERIYEVEKEKFENIVDTQPGHINHNPW